MSYFMALLLKYRGKAFFICNTEQEIAGYCIAPLNYISNKNTLAIGIFQYQIKKL